MASTVNGDLEKIEAALDRANELAASAAGIGNTVDLALDWAMNRVADKLATAAERRTPPEVHAAAAVAEVDDFMADPFDFSPGDQAWRGGLR